ncbi:type 1 glutamine amidotransferase domain-containing protein [Agromyces seonyuensis]|uniref:Type 1 glutamine amidotransferase domain-containing protein n=1 Tax=Agromyces seonyuensis TaxID=2662446 RepID=A0A6I4NZR8_9MICO|nr:type 1 glutamine amidotransferase domain-containing protein [Agromyces seonyuensis]MWB99816.1 type 1 glutamine amidotransferase domain-containing protein [Agromyces seonyuensis]
MANVLMIVTAADAIELVDGTSQPTGYWAEELVVAHRGLRGAGHDVVVATPGGKPAPVDPGSIDPEQIGDDLSAELTAYLELIAEELEHPQVLAEQSVVDYDAVVLPGGHGPMVDLAIDADLGLLLAEADATDVVIAPFCHGPAALTSAIAPDGTFVFADRLLTVFTDAEERAGGLGLATPWWVEGRLLELGAIVESAKPFESHVVRDGNLISGQNPQSSAAVVEEVLDALDEYEDDDLGEVDEEE